jgi:hypothetical protein
VVKLFYLSPTLFPPRPHVEPKFQMAHHPKRRQLSFFDQLNGVTSWFLPKMV